MRCEFLRHCPKKNLQKGLTRKPQSLILNNVDKTFPDSSMVEHSTVNRVVVSSSLTRGANGRMVKRLRHRPFTAVSGGSIPPPVTIFFWALSSAGRASALQAECQQFDPVSATILLLFITGRSSVRPEHCLGSRGS